jgi:hypothetical protein
MADCNLVARILQSGQTEADFHICFHGQQCAFVSSGTFVSVRVYLCDLMHKFAAIRVKKLIIAMLGAAESRKAFAESPKS